MGGFKGEFAKAPSGVNQTMKLQMLREEGVVFDEKGWLVGGAAEGTNGKERGGKDDVWWTPTV